jgi:hypothetical protein
MCGREATFRRTTQMAKKQTRRSVSIRGSTYEQIRKYCERHEISMSEFVEERIAAFFGNGGSRKDAPYDQLKGDELKDAARYFTF